MSRHPLLHRHVLSSSQERLLQVLARVQFATAAQLSIWCDVSLRTICTNLEALYEMRFIQTGADTKPQIWHLTHAAGARMKVPMPSGRRHSSWSVMQNAVHRNAVEILLAKDYLGFRFLTRHQLYKKGFNPSHGEYAGVDEKGTTWLVLIDDYMMESRVIEKHWNRIHRPPRKYWPDVGRSWSSTVNKYLVVTTSLEHLQRHEDFVETSTVPADVLYLKPIW